MSYTDEEKARAKQTLPGALAEFIDSKELAAAYVEIQKKHTLNLRQIAAVADLTTWTLLALEPESAFENSLRRSLPELPPETHAGIIDDIGELIFKEARKRLRESTAPDEPDTQHP